MLLKPITESPFTTTDQLYNSLNNFSQSELMEKFNLAFYEAQAVSKSDIIDTLKDLQDTITSPKDTVGTEKEEAKTNDDYLIDYLISEDSAASPKDCDINFDFNDFVEDFDHNVRDSFSDSTTVVEFDTETYTTENSKDYEECGFDSTTQFSNFFVPPPIWTSSEKEYDIGGDNILEYDRQTQPKSLEKNDFDDIDICEVLSNASLDIGEWSSEIQDLDESENGYSNPLPPVGTITKSNFDFNCYVRNIPADDMGYFKQDPESKSEFGHLIEPSGIRNCELIVNTYEKDHKICHVLEQNHMILRQSDALLNDDPLLSSSNNFYTNHNHLGPSDDHGSDNKHEEEPIASTHYQCKWENCYQKCHSQTGLVSHIEKCHVEIKRGDEFTCYWEQCPRKTKPFNARYKLLIHMRVHSGEKPNKCPFKGCNKAFSRLENLKIHQRSHTGERPYLCQFTGCSKCFSNSSDRAKHQRTHFDTKPYGCQVVGCFKKYTDPSSLRKHVKNHSHEEQLQIKKKSHEEGMFSNVTVKKMLDPSRQKAIKIDPPCNSKTDHTYSNLTHQSFHLAKYVSMNVKQDLKNKIEKNKIQRTMF